MITKAQADALKVGDKITVGGRVVEIVKVLPYTGEKYPLRDGFMNDPNVWPMFKTTFYLGIVGWEAVD